jgi:hypothetical protein
MMKHIFFAFLLTLSMAYAGLLAPQEYEVVKSLGAELTKRAPPQDYLYVGIGRSPTALITFLSILYPGSGIQLPLTQAQYLERNHKHFAKAREITDLHFEQFLGPQIEKLKGRKLMFLDFVVNGSFQSALNMISDFLSRKYPHVKYDFMALSTRYNVIGKEGWIPLNKVLIVDNPSNNEFYRRLVISYYDTISEYGSWHAGYFYDDVYEKPKKQAAFEAYKNEMILKVEGDSELAKSCRYAAGTRF